jgi:hypothetical protein
MWLPTGEQLGALTIGVAGSLAAWFVLQRVRIQYEWSPWVAEGVQDDVRGPVRYSVKVRRKAPRSPLTVLLLRWRLRLTRRRRRHLVDVRLHVQFRIRGLYGRPRSTIRNLRLRGTDWVPLIRGDRVLVVDPSRLDPEDVARLPEPCRSMFADRDVTLRDLLEFSRDGVEVGLVAHIVGFDSFSGTRGVYTSPEYTAASLRRGKFARDSLEVLPWSDGSGEPAPFGDD